MKYRTIMGIGISLWVVGDLATTWYGFYLGMREQNPLMSWMPIYMIFITKTMAGILLWVLATHHSVSASNLRYISMLAVWIMAIIIVSLNSYAIIQWSLI